jgi:hypothetical protein
MISKEMFAKLEVAVGFEQAMELATGLNVSSKKSPVKKPHLDKLEGIPWVEGKFTDVPSAVTACLAQCAFIPWSAAYAALYAGDFRSVCIPKIIAAFEATEKGASALIVDSNGYHKDKVATQHRKWLESRGYSTFPGVK